MNFFLRLGTLMSFLVIFTPLQAQFFAGPANQATCEGAGIIMNFDAFFINDPTTPLTVAEFQYITSDITLTLNAPALGSGQTFTLPPTTSGTTGVTYVLEVTNTGNNYQVRLSITGGITMAIDGSTYSAVAVYGGAAPPPNTTSTTATLTVSTPIVITIDSPAALATSVCEGGPISIDASTSSVPATHQWLLNGVPVTAATMQDLSIPSASLADAGNYQLKITDPGCPDLTSNAVAVGVIPSANILETDMAAKELAPGNTVCFEVEVDNIDNTSVYTWTIDGNSFTDATVPGTITVGGNTIDVVDILNTPLGVSSVRSKLTLSNTSAASAPFYTGTVDFGATNNVACVATTASVIANQTTIFPVEWQQFTAKPMGKNEVLLQWITATEANNEQFQIERSINGRTFEKIGTVAGSGTSTTAQAYAWSDRQLPKDNSTLYYRLRQVDFDGSEGFSSVEKVEFDNGETILGPVVAIGGELNATVATAAEGALSYQVYDTRGVLLSQGEAMSYGAETRLRFPAPSVAGAYFLQVVYQGEVYSRTFVR